MPWKRPGGSAARALASSSPAAAIWRLRARRLGKDVLAVSSNAADLSAQAELAKTLGKEFGALDILVLNAGIVEMRPLEKWDEAAFDRNFDINFKGPFFLIQARSSRVRHP